MATNSIWLAKASRLLKRKLRQLDAHFEELQASVKDGDQGPPGPEGQEGPPGPKGEKPAHEWRGPKLRFEKPDGSWGKWTNLEGPAGRRGGGGGGGGSFSPGALPLATLPINDTDKVIIERAGNAYRVSVEELKQIFGQGGASLCPDQIFAGDIPIYGGFDCVTASE